MRSPAGAWRSGRRTRSWEDGSPRPSGLERRFASWAPGTGSPRRTSRPSTCHGSSRAATFPAEPRRGAWHKPHEPPPPELPGWPGPLERLEEVDMRLPRGFVASAIRAGIRTKGPDVALIVAEGGANAAAVFTRNRFLAAPVVLSKAALKKTGGKVRCVVVNAGCANAITGAPGMAAARRVQ